MTSVLLRNLESTGVPYDSQWLRLYQALGDSGGSGDFDPLAATHVADETREMILRLRAANFLAELQRPPREYVGALTEAAPEALRDDALCLLARTEPERTTSLLREQSNAVRALVAATT